MNSYNKAYEFSLSDVVVQVDKLILKKGAKRLFQKHLDKVFREAVKYGKYLNAEYNKAKEKGLIRYEEQPSCGGKDWHWYTASPGNTTPEYFMDDEDVLAGWACFWMQGPPKLDPLSFLFSMARGCVGKQHENLALLDYQYVIVACIHDQNSWVAGQTPIYFDHSDHKEFKYRICKKILQKIGEPKHGSTVQTTIQMALQAVQNDCTKGQPKAEDG